MTRDETAAQALRWLARRDYAAQELKQRLIMKGADNGTCEDVISEMQELGYQSDERFTEVFVRQRLERRQGPRKIEWDLRSRGVDDTLIDAHLSSVADEVWIQNASEALRSRFPRPHDDLKQKAARQRFLVGRGFEHHHIRQALLYKNYDEYE